jgi:hypothetical protein
MLNDSYWKEYNDGERAFLWSAEGEKIAYIQRKDGIWSCFIYEEFISEDFYWRGMDSIKEVEWQVTLYIGNKCDRITSQLQKFRDHLPSVHELADRARKEE